MCKRIGVILGLLIMLMFSGPVAAYAQTGAEGNDADTTSTRSDAPDEQTKEKKKEEKQTEEGKSEEVALPKTAFSEDGNGTLGNNATSADNKEFITVTTKKGNVFYLVIDRERDSDNVYFLNMVDESDLQAFIEEAENKDLSSVLSLPEKNESTKVDVDVDKEEKGDSSKVDLMKETEKEPSGDNQRLYIIFGVCGVVLIAAYYFKFKKGKDGFDEYESEDEYEEDEYEKDDDSYEEEEVYHSDDFPDREEEVTEIDEAEEGDQEADKALLQKLDLDSDDLDSFDEEEEYEDYDEEEDY